MKGITLALIAILVLAGATTASADDSGWYVVGGVGGTDTNPLILDTQNSLIAARQSGFVYSSNSGMSAYRLHAGYQLSEYFAVEGGYVNLGNFKYTATGGTLASPYSISSTIKASYLDGVALLPFGNHFSLLAKLGIAHSTSSSVAGVPVDFAGISKTGFTTGLGVKYEFANGVSIQYEEDSYNVGASDLLGAGFFSLGYKF